ncbi:MAG: hypothetical protein SGARI_000330 [Bacillariaceae sp.]
MMHISQPGPTKSPWTNEILTSLSLFDATPIKNAIEILIDNGGIKGDLARTWLERTAKTGDILKKAHQGDLQAMINVAENYWFGTSDEFEEDIEQAIRWARKAHTNGHVSGTKLLADFLLNAPPGYNDMQQGMEYLALAASRGSKYAAYELGKAFFDGTDSLEKNKLEAMRLLELSLDETHCPDEPGLCGEYEREARLLLALAKESA